MIKLKIVTVIAVALLSCVTHAQKCKYDAISSSHRPGQYLDNKNGTVTDIINGLQWQQCSVGQKYDKKTRDCLGEPENLPTWQSALQRAESLKNYVGKSDWRLPNISELGSLVERACFDPATTLSVFPSTPSVIYWSNTPDADRINIYAGRLIDFRDGTEFATDVSTHKLIRLVRDIKGNQQ